MIKSLSFFLILCLSCFLQACDTSQKDKAEQKTLKAEKAYMLAVAPGQTRAAVYLSLINLGEEERSINLVSSNIAGYGEVHNHIHKDGVMSMRKVNHPKVAAKSTLTFAPSGYHIMLMDIAETPKVGSDVELVLEFDKAESLKVRVEVRSIH